MRILKFTLPQHWASYLINGDAPGLDFGEQAKIDNWLQSQDHKLGGCLSCDNEDVFSRSNDCGALPGPVADFYFPIIPRKVSRRLYVGMANGGWSREVFRHATEPTAQSHPQYSAVIGPFRTLAGARLCVNEPQACSTVAEYERVACKLFKTVRECARKAKEETAAR